MLLAYILLVIACGVLTARLVQRRSRAVLVGGMATLCAALAIPTGFSIGPYLAALAAGLAIAAGARVWPSRHVA